MRVGTSVGCEALGAISVVDHIWPPPAKPLKNGNLVKTIMRSELSRQYVQR